MTPVIFLTVLFLIVAIVKFLGAHGLKDKVGMLCVFLAGLFLALAIGPAALDVRDGLAGAADGIGDLVAGLFR